MIHGKLAAIDIDCRSFGRRNQDAL